jgi:hypothetical protein
MADTGAGAVYLLLNTTGAVVKLDPAVATDVGSTITVDLITNKYDMDTINRKFMSNFRIVGDRYASNSVDVRWTDDDYQTWSGWKTVSLSDDFPNFARLGVFRRRAFQIRHAANSALRLESFEVTFTEGSC